jgi:hypothetical protein
MFFQVLLHIFSILGLFSSILLHTFPSLLYIFLSIYHSLCCLSNFFIPDPNEFTCYEETSAPPMSSTMLLIRVRHGYTVGTDFLDHTHTRVDRTRGGYGYIPYHLTRYATKTCSIHYTCGFVLLQSPCNLVKAARTHQLTWRCISRGIDRRRRRRRRRGLTYPSHALLLSLYLLVCSCLSPLVPARSVPAHLPWFMCAHPCWCCRPSLMSTCPCLSSPALVCLR